MLKKIEAIIREDKVNDVRDALKKIGIVGMNMIEIRGHGRQGGIKLLGRAGSYQIDMLTKIQINIILSEQNLEDTIEAILSSASTGQPGDGIIFIYPVDEVVRIRTRERGQEAVMYPNDIDAMKKKGTT